MNFKLNTILSGVAGEYFVAAELSRRGFSASITLRNTRGIDILVANLDATRSVGIQVKTNQGSEKYWILHKKIEEGCAENLFFIFVNLNHRKKPPEYHVAPSSVVADFCKESHKEWLAKPGLKGRLHKDNTMRKFSDGENKYRDRWDLLGL